MCSPIYSSVVSIYLGIWRLRTFLGASLYILSLPWKNFISIVCKWLFRLSVNTHIRYRKNQCRDSYGFVHFDFCVFPYFILEISIYFSTNMKYINFIFGFPFIFVRNMVLGVTKILYTFNDFNLATVFILTNSFQKKSVVFYSPFDILKL